MSNNSATGPDSQQLSKHERQICRQKSKELDLVNKRLNCMAELKIKIILVGNSAVGKTSLIQKFVDNKADIRTTQVTMLCDFYHCMMPLTGRSVHIRMWDTGGMERFHQGNLVSSFYRKSDGVLLVFSIDDMASFQALPHWLQRVRENIGPGSQFDCCVVGNKSDRTNKRLVSRQEAERFSHQLGYPYIETSALDVVNVHKAFTDLALAVIKRNQITQHVAAAAPSPEKPISLFQRRSGGGGGRGGADRSCGCG